MPDRMLGKPPECTVDPDSSDTIWQQDYGLHRALGGDREALGRLFVSSMPRLYRAALRILRNHQDAEEALQDGFLAAICHLGEFECRSRFSTWLTRIVVNVALMRLRKSRREVLTPFDQEGERDEADTAVPVTDPRPNPEEAYAWKERLQILQNTVWKLPPTYRLILWMRDVQNLRTQEVAELLGVKAATVKSTLHRARRKLWNGGPVGQRCAQSFSNLAARAWTGGFRAPFGPRTEVGDPAA